MPFNFDGYTYADWAIEHNLPVVLVVRHYLGSINHTHLTLEVIKNRGLKLLGVIISGNVYPEAEALLKREDVTILGRLPETSDLNELTIEWYEELG